MGGPTSHLQRLVVTLSVPCKLQIWTWKILKMKNYCLVPILKFLDYVKLAQLFFWILRRNYGLANSKNIFVNSCKYLKNNNTWFILFESGGWTNFTDVINVTLYFIIMRLLNLFKMLYSPKLLGKDELRFTVIC